MSKEFDENPVIQFHELPFVIVVISFSNNMLYPKEDKENRILLYAVSFKSQFYQVSQ